MNISPYRRIGCDGPRTTEETVHVVTQSVLVAVGGALGSLLRWGVGLAFGRLFGQAFPWGTFFINISGSLFLGWFTTMLEQHLFGDWIDDRALRLLIAIGFTGGYTTFSTFEYESYKLVQDGGLAGPTYMAGSVFLGLLAVEFGVYLARIGRDV